MPARDQLQTHGQTLTRQPARQADRRVAGQVERVGTGIPRAPQRPPVPRDLDILRRVQPDRQHRGRKRGRGDQVHPIEQRLHFGETVRPRELRLEEIGGRTVPPGLDRGDQGADQEFGCLLHGLCEPCARHCAEEDREGGLQRTEVDVDGFDYSPRGLGLFQRLPGDRGHFRVECVATGLKVADAKRPLAAGPRAGVGLSPTDHADRDRRARRRASAPRPPSSPSGRHRNWPRKDRAPAVRQHAQRGFEARIAAAGRGDTDRPAPVRPRCHRAHAGGDRHGGPAAEAAVGVAGVPRVRRAVEQGAFRRADIACGGCGADAFDDYGRHRWARMRKAPGATTFTVTPGGASSRASGRVKPRIPILP